MKHQVWLKLLVIVVGIVLLSACAHAYAVEVGQSAPDFSLSSMGGQKTSMSDFKGKAIILNFFATWCPPCKGEIPDFVELQKTYGDKGFTFIGVSLCNAQDTKTLADKLGINYPVLIDDGKVSVAYGPVRSIPTTFVINKDGKVVNMYIGARDRATFENDIKGLIK